MGGFFGGTPTVEEGGSFQHGSITTSESFLDYLAGALKRNPREWSEAVTGLLRQSLNVQNRGPKEIEERADFLAQVALQDPARFKRLSKNLGIVLDESTGQGAVDPVDALLGALAGALSGSSAQRVVRVQQDYRSRVSEVSTSVTGQRTTRFVDKPTAEEFLNQWEVGFATHVSGMERNGWIDQATAQFARENSELFFDQYLALLGRQARAGKDIFRVVGAEGGARKVGERFGGRDRSVTGTKTERKGSRKTDEQRFLEGGGQEPFSEETTFDETERGLVRTDVRTREDIYERPNLTTVFAISPLQFLQGAVGAQEMRTFFQGQKGARQRQAQTAIGPTVSAPRRVF